MIKHYGLYIFTFFLLFSLQTKAQTSISVDTIGLDSLSISNPCNNNVYLTLWVTTSGYVAGDSVMLKVFYGDGTQDSAKFPIYIGPPQAVYGYFNHTYLFPGIFSPMVIAVAPDGKRDSLIANNLINTLNCGPISGNIYFDNNNNCVNDAGDYQTKFRWVKATNILSGSVHHAYTDVFGNYSINLPSSSQYNIEVNTGYLRQMCPNGGLTAVSAPSSGNDLAVQCVPGYDLAGYVWGNTTTGIRVNTSRYFVGKVMNYSCNPKSGTYMIVLSDPDLSYVPHLNKPSYASYPTKVSGDTIYFDFTNLTHYNYFLSPLNMMAFGIKASANVNIGDTLCFDMIVTPTNGDVDPSNNSKRYCLRVTNSYDPNNKIGFPLGSGPDRVIDKGQSLEYTINFQNTGNDTAYNVFVIDSLPEYLNISTMEILASSHDMNFYYMGENSVKFEFNDIYLPDSNINEPLSHGYVSFTIDQKADLEGGTVIENEAHIYFDYNEAIITNTERHTIDIIDGVEVYWDREIEYSFYPNPNDGNMWIDLNTTSAGLKVYSVFGRMIFEDEIHEGKQMVELNQLPDGIYFIEVSVDSVTSVKKMIVSH